MNIEIESTNLGAELTSIKVNGIEKLHQGEKVLNQFGEVYWKRHAPILFPIVGALKDGKTRIYKKEYYMPQHGFARDMKWESLKKEENYHSYILTDNNETKKMYPFKFELYTEYEIIDNKIITRYKVINKDKKEMLFSIGGHPAYICDVPSEKYVIEFEKEEYDVKILRLQRGLVSNSNYLLDEKLIKDNKYIELQKDTFDYDAIIMKNLKSNEVYLIDKEENRKILTFNFENFPYLALWSKPNAPFVCIEPWYNTADSKDTNGEFDTKENLLHLNPKEKFECSYTVEFN